MRQCGNSFNRRDFLKVSSATMAGLMAGGAGTLSAREAAGGMKYRELGTTKLRVSEIGMGGRTTEGAVVEHAFDKGITLFHTSPGYLKGQSIAALGAALKNLKSRRSQIVVALKSAKLGEVDEELKTLNTDHVDLYIQPMDEKAMANPELPALFEKLKKSGKARFCGFTNHKGMADSMKAALKLKCMEVVLATYNLANRGELDPILKQLSAEGTGFLAMKTRKDVPEADQPKTALSLLENKDLHSILVGMPTMQDVDKWAEVPGKKMTMWDRRGLNRLKLAMAGVCGSCGRCEKECPRRIPAPDIFRFHMYATQYEASQQAVGLAEYRKLAPKATAANCDDCGACERVCPNAVPIRRRLREAHTLLA